TVIAAPSSSGADNISVVADGIVDPTLFEGFEVDAPSPSSGSGLNSIGIYASDSNANLEIRSNTIKGGAAQDGASGASGGDGTTGPSGHDGAGASGTFQSLASIQPSP